jgi:hypothetical protein
MFALNFYSEAYADMLKRGRKTATIRLGDKSDKYQPGQLVWITVGRRFGPRQKLFTAIIDEVLTKPAGDLTSREVEKENPEMRLPEEVMTLLSRIYDRIITPLDTVTVISFSPVYENESESLEEIFRHWMV